MLDNVLDCAAGIPESSCPERGIPFLQT